MGQAAPTLDRVLALLARRGDGIPATVGGPDRLEDLGVDSLDLVYVLSTFERADDAQFEDSDFDRERYDTVADLAAMIDRRLRG